MKKRWSAAMIVLSAAIAIWGLCVLLPRLSDAMAKTIAVPAGTILGRWTACVPFPLTEPLFLLLVLSLPFLLKKCPVAPAALALLFAILWAPLLYRTPIRETMNLKKGLYTAQDIYDAVTELSKTADALRDASVAQAVPVENIPSLAQDALEQIGIEVPEVKYARYPELLSLAGAVGMYVPVTGEALVSEEDLYFAIPFTAAHESAHRAGYGREDEANYIAYEACMKGNRLFRYSGTMFLLKYAMDALHDADSVLWTSARNSFSDGVRGDLYRMNAFGDAKETRFTLLQKNVSDAFLRVTGQDGVTSYAGMLSLWMDGRDLTW